MHAHLRYEQCNIAATNTSNNTISGEQETVFKAVVLCVAFRCLGAHFEVLNATSQHFTLGHQTG